MAEDRLAPDTLAQDWATLWQSELAAIAADPETTLGLESLFAAWLQAARAFDASAWDPTAWPDAPARPAAAGAAAGARDATVEQLRHRVDELERRLAGLGRADGDADPGHAGADG
jgi:hypothetical protein